MDRRVFLFGDNQVNDCPSHDKSEASALLGSIGYHFSRLSSLGIFKPSQ